MQAFGESQLLLGPREMVGRHSSGQRPREQEQHQGRAPRGSHMLGRGTRQPKTPAPAVQHDPAWTLPRCSRGRAG